MSEPVQTPSGIPLEAVYGPADRARDQPAPGVYPYKCVLHDELGMVGQIVVLP